MTMSTRTTALNRDAEDVVAGCAMCGTQHPLSYARRSPELGDGPLHEGGCGE